MEEYDDEQYGDSDDDHGDSDDEVILTQEIHTIPVRDTLEHSMSTRCDCRPKVSVKHSTLIITHNSFDNREVVEDMLEGLDINTTGEDAWINIVVDI